MNKNTYNYEMHTITLDSRPSWPAPLDSVFIVEKRLQKYRTVEQTAL